ncbi:hypothetical protein ACNTMW_14430 [Planosporangium sp. 12N6]|uniref:hypothetical protein n=1 Tax=Planosporangium spinosum TaxID=3402278 RepID=UPI003CF4C1DC
MNAPATLAAPAGFVPAIAVALWLGLLAVAGLVLLVTGWLAWRQRRAADPVPAPPPVTPLRTRRPRAGDLARLLAEVDALCMQAVSAGIAAADAQAAVAVARARCRTAEWVRERAWYEYDTAQQAYVTALRTAVGGEVWPAASASGAWPVLTAEAAEAPGPAAEAPGPAGDGEPAGPPVPAEPDPRDEVARAALGAYRRGGISVDELRAVLRHASGWNQVHARHEREVLLRRAAERAAHRRYHAAAVAERSAYQAVDVATVAARAWADEAETAAEEARLARAYVNDCLRRATGRRWLPRPRRSRAVDAAA